MPMSAGDGFGQSPIPPTRAAVSTTATTLPGWPSGGPVGARPRRWRRKRSAGAIRSSRPGSHDRERTALVPRSGCRGACRKRHPGRGRRAPLADLGHAPACRSSRGEIRARRDADRPASVGRIGTGGDRSAVAGAFAGGSEMRGGVAVWQASGSLARHGHRPFRLAGAYAPCQSLAQTAGAGYFAKNTCPSGRS